MAHPTKKLLEATSQAWWQRTSRAFHLHTSSVFEPRIFDEIPWGDNYMFWKVETIWCTYKFVSL
jgi:hypothetical protein